METRALFCKFNGTEVGQTFLSVPWPGKREADRQECLSYLRND